MSRWPPHLTDALEPRPEELAGLMPPAAPRWCADATSPSDAELGRLLAHASRLPARRRRPNRALAWGLAAAVTLLAVLHLIPLPSDPEPSALVDDSALHFGPSITVRGDGEIQVIRTDADGTELALLAGRATFEVDPTGEQRHLEVRAGDVRVEVTGTRFTVALEGDRVSVEVLRGSVQIHRPGDSLGLHAGERWSGLAQPTEQAAATPTGPEVREPDAGARAPRTAPRAPTTEGPPPRAETPAPSTEQPAPAEIGSAAPTALSGRTAAEAWAALLAKRAAGAEPEAQLAALDRFLAEHQDPVLETEASALRLGLLAQQLPGEEVLPELDTWLAGHPDHARSLELELLRATVAREQLGDCGLALSSYTRVAREATGTLQATAQAWADYCRERSSR